MNLCLVHELKRAIRFKWPGIKFLLNMLVQILEVVCGDKQTIKIQEIQRQGKKPQNIGEFMLGSQIKKGAII